MSSVPPPWVAPDPALRAHVAQRVEARFASGRGSPKIDSYYFRDTRSWLDAPDRWFGEEENFLVGRSSGVPVRTPFRDPDLIDFLVTIRPLGRSEDGLSKAFLRRRLVRRFPRLGFDRQRKTNLGEAFLDVLARQAGSQFRALGGLKTLADMGVVDARQAGDLLGDTLAGTGPRARAGFAWIILNLETWVRAHT
jgi:hypothetical protein